MKKLAFIFLSLVFVFVSCKKEPTQTLSDPDNIAYENNKQDSDFTVIPNKSVWFNFSIGTIEGYSRTKGTTGIIGNWSLNASNYSKELKINNDGTFSAVNNASSGTILEYFTMMQNIT